MIRGEDMEKESRNTKVRFIDFKLMIIGFIITVISELIGVKNIALSSKIVIALFPMLFSMILGMISYFVKITDQKQSEEAGNLIVIAILPLIAKLGTMIGPSLSEVLSMGLALALQEIGHIGSILIALPIGYKLGMKRELVGLTHSIGREANVSLVAEKFGIDSPEGRGVMTIYVVGTLLGTLFYGLVMPIFTLIPFIHVESWAMACGVGSGSMMAAASGALANVFPERANDIIAYAGASQVLTTATGLLMSILVLLPITERLYKFLDSKNGEVN